MPKPRSWLAVWRSFLGLFLLLFERFLGAVLEQASGASFLRFFANFGCHFGLIFGAFSREGGNSVFAIPSMLKYDF